MSIRFCEECGNMLTPLENPNKKVLSYECKMCKIKGIENENSEKNNIVYRNEVKLGQTEVKINNSIINDPTYARTFDLECPKCHYREAICFQNPNINDPGMKFYYLCCNKNYNDTGEPCGKKWLKGGKDDKNTN